MISSYNAVKFLFFGEPWVKWRLVLFIYIHFDPSAGLDRPKGQGWIPAAFHAELIAHFRQNRLIRAGLDQNLLG